MDTELLNSTYETTHPFKLRGVVKAKVVKVYDADTLTCCFRPHEGSPLYRYSIRVCYFDSAEIKSKTAVERKLAKMARDFVHDLLFHKVVTLEIVPEDDKYGRILAKVLYEDTASPGVHKNLSDTVLEKQLANPYEGGTKSDFTKLIEHHKLDESACLMEELELKSSKNKKKK